MRFTVSEIISVFFCPALFLLTHLLRFSSFFLHFGDDNVKLGYKLPLDLDLFKSRDDSFISRFFALLVVLVTLSLITSTGLYLLCWIV